MRAERASLAVEMRLAFLPLWAAWAASSPQASPSAPSERAIASCLPGTYRTGAGGGGTAGP